MKRIERLILRVVVATGIASVAVQLLTIREFLAQFQGNEYVIALIMFGWLALGGVGTRLARRQPWTPTAGRLALLSLVLVLTAWLQLLAIRLLRDVVFTHGVSVGFYQTLGFIVATLTPYGLLVGFVLPYSLYVLRRRQPDFPGARIYITDNLGDVLGGALFSFVLVHLLPPFGALLLANLPLIIAAGMLWQAAGQRGPVVIAASTLALGALVSGVWLEPQTLVPREGRLAYYRESRYGRITVHQDQEQLTLFKDGVPVFSSQNLAAAEEAVHYPLSQLDAVRRVLLVSGESGMMTEVAKYQPRQVDYVELDPEITRVQFKFNLLASIPGLNVIHQDGRSFVYRTQSRYDAVLLNLPEPDTFQVNRFFTEQFFERVKAILAPGGLLSFAMQGFDNYLAEPQRQKLSTLFQTAAAHFDQVLLLPGERIYFLCRDGPITTDIPARLAALDIATQYIRGYFYGNVTAQRIERLNSLIDPAAPRNRDEAPRLMQLMFAQWFARFDSSPTVFMIALALVTLVYLVRMSRPEFVLFSTGFLTMGSEILVIFAFQIFFGYIYLQIGLIVTVFLAGLLPGAWLGNRLQASSRRVLALSDAVLIALLVVLAPTLKWAGDQLPATFFLLFGFLVALACGFQFPVALNLEGGSSSAVARTFSADLIGAACAALAVNTILIPYLGMMGAIAALVGLKMISLGLLALPARSA